MEFCVVDGFGMKNWRYGHEEAKLYHIMDTHTAGSREAFE